jgi:hypothetical protein
MKKDMKTPAHRALQFFKEESEMLINYVTVAICGLLPLMLRHAKELTQKELLKKKYQKNILKINF